ncbi:MAG: hypothetical protein P8J33_17745 [Pirellulaceae bacterium]|nr:hypothetical protein [Pirellulaceae bacterium]
MKNSNRITQCIATAVAVFAVQFATAGVAVAAPQSKLTSFFSGPAACDSGCDDACDGNCRTGGGIFDRLGKRGCNQVRCPDCENCFPEEYCTLKVEMGEREFTCYEVDYKTICVPKVTFPWQKRKCGGCGNLGGCDGACDSLSNGACDGCDGNGCDANGCDGNGCGQGCGGGVGCRICKNKAKGCCPPACIDIPCSPCAKTKSVKFLTKQKYKCPQCKCRWEVVKPALPAVPNASPIQQPTPAQPASTVMPFQGSPSQVAPQTNKTESNGYFGQAKPFFQRIPLLTAKKPTQDYSTEFSLSDSEKAKSTWTVGDLLRRR